MPGGSPPASGACGHASTRSITQSHAHLALPTPPASTPTQACCKATARQDSGVERQGAHGHQLNKHLMNHTAAPAATLAATSHSRGRRSQLPSKDPGDQDRPGQARKVPALPSQPSQPFHGCLASRGSCPSDRPAAPGASGPLPPGKGQPLSWKGEPREGLSKSQSHSDCHLPQRRPRAGPAPGSQCSGTTWVATAFALPAQSPSATQTSLPAGPDALLPGLPSLLLT